MMQFSTRGLNFPKAFSSLNSKIGFTIYAFILLAATSLVSADLPNLDPPSAGYSQTGADLTSAYITKFWNSSGGNIFSNPDGGSETVASAGNTANGYTFWSSLLGLQGLIEGERQRPGDYSYWIWTIYNNGLEQYFNSDWHAYMAWLMFPGNDESYYDDNAWAVIALVEAYQVTQQSDSAHSQIYLNRASEIMNGFEIFGWDSGSPGGMRWCTSSTVSGATDRTVSATAGAALAAFMLHEAGLQPSFGGTWLDWGTGALEWVLNNVQDTDNLIMDGKKNDGTLLSTKWTYNSGVIIRALSLRYSIAGEASDLSQAEAIASATLNHAGALFDGLVSDSTKRTWYDGTYFAHYLVDGLLKLHDITASTDLKNSIYTELQREAAYIYNYIRDTASGDNMYWRNLRLWRIGPAQDQEWEQLTGQTQALDQDPSEMSGTQYVKTLLANAGTARLFWQAGGLLD